LRPGYIAVHERRHHSDLDPAGCRR
jgi:hypothetical protein